MKLQLWTNNFYISTKKNRSLHVLSYVEYIVRCVASLDQIICTKPTIFDNFNFIKKKILRELLNASNLNLALFDLTSNDTLVEKLRKSLEIECEGSKVLETYIKVAILYKNSVF